MPVTKQKDVVTRLTETGEEALQRLLQNPSAARFVNSANALRDRVDELTRRMRSLDPLEKRVAELEKRLDELAPKAKKPAARTPAKKPASAAKKPAASAAKKPAAKSSTTRKSAT